MPCISICHNAIFYKESLSFKMELLMALGLKRKLPYLLMLSLLAWPTAMTAITEAPATPEGVAVGVFYYAWYEGGLGGGHWNDTLAYGAVVDRPVPYGFYSSQNLTVVEWQIGLMREAGVDFALISWWGPNSYTDNSTKKFIEALDGLGYPSDFAILVEPYYGLNFTQAYNYILR